MSRLNSDRTRPHPAAGEEGFLLLGLVVAIFLILLFLGVAAPRVARALRREKEVESQHRAEQYVRAIQLYYKKFGHYPGSIEQLEKSNNQRFLRQKYIDPLTGKADWKPIPVGQAKTTVKGFFGQPLTGLPSAGLGSAASLASPGGVGTPAGSATSTFGSSSPSGSAFGSSAAGGSAFGSSGSSGSAFGSSAGSTSGASSPGGLSSGNASTTAPGGATGGSTSAFGSGSSTSGSGISSQSATSFQGGGSPFMGVGSAATGDSIVVVNEQTTYPTWEFLYDPRIEQLKAKVSLFGGGPASTSATSLGSASSLGTGFGGAQGATGGLTASPGANGTAGSAGSSGTAPTGTQPATTPQ